MPKRLRGGHQRGHVGRGVKVWACPARPPRQQVAGWDRHGRELVLHPTTVTALREYLRERDRLHPVASSPALLISTAGTRLIYCNVHHTFHRLVAMTGLVPRSPSCRPRIHDLRHSFAVNAMLDAYATGEDGQLRLTLLSTYLGHADPAATYWYLSASPELLALAAHRMDTVTGGRS